MSTHWERAQQKRAERLDEIDKAVEKGSLVIRQMTDAERERYPRVEPKPNRRPTRWSR